jgi:hypothetical protein
MKPLSEFCCINEDCPEHGERDGENLRVHQTYGKSDTIRLLECKVCAEGCGQRQTCRLVGVSRDAVSRLTRIAGDHARALHDELLRDLQVKEAQADEKWNFVGKKRESMHR